MPAAVSTGVVTPTVIVHTVNDKTYAIIPLIPDCDIPSRIEIIPSLKLLGEGMFDRTLDVAKHGDGHAKPMPANTRASVANFFFFPIELAHTDDFLQYNVDCLGSTRCVGNVW